MIGTFALERERERVVKRERDEETCCSVSVLLLRLLLRLLLPGVVLGKQASGEEDHVDRAANLFCLEGGWNTEKFYGSSCGALGVSGRALGFTRACRVRHAEGGWGWGM